MKYNHISANGYILYIQVLVWSMYLILSNKGKRIRAFFVLSHLNIVVIGHW